MGLRDIIKGLDREEKQEEVREIIVRENEVVKEIGGIWRGFYNKVEKEWLININFEVASREVIGYNSEDIKLWSVGFKVGEKHPYFSRHIGFFTSSLVIKSNDEKHELIIENWDVLPDFLGYKYSEGRELVVIGDCGHNTGDSNKGILIIRGNCGINVGSFNKGILEISGDCGDYAGCYNYGNVRIGGNCGNFSGYWNSGVIEINGDCGDGVGYENSGSMNIEGSIGSLSEYLGSGDIIHKGELIVKEGRKI